MARLGRRTPFQVVTANQQRLAIGTPAAVVTPPRPSIIGAKQGKRSDRSRQSRVVFAHAFAGTQPAAAVVPPKPVLVQSAQRRRLLVGVLQSPPSVRGVAAVTIEALVFPPRPALLRGAPQRP